MDPSPSELRALLALLLSSACVAVAVVVLVVRSGRVVPPAAWLLRQPRSRSRPEDHVSIR